EFGRLNLVDAVGHLPVVDPHRERVALDGGLRLQRREADAVALAERLAGIGDGRLEALHDRHPRWCDDGDDAREHGERERAAHGRARADRLIYWFDRVSPRRSHPGPFVNVAPEPAAARSEVSGRAALRARLRAERDTFVASGAFAAAADALASHLRAALAADARFAKVERALPYARREARAMEFRRWDGGAPTLVDECGIGASDGAVVVPDVVVVPCVGFTAEGHRLGSGAGYYDRWLAAHPHVVAVGVAWSVAEIDAAALVPEPHDVPLAFVVTERGVR